jgi:DNA polymerase-1
LTERIFLQQRGELKEKGLLPVLYNRCLLTPVLADIEKNGMQLDTEAVTSLSHVIEQEYLAVTNELNRTTGGIDTAGPKKLGEYLYDTLGFDEVMIKRNGQWVPDRTKTKMRKTDQETIGKLRAKTEKQKAFLSLYKRQKEKFNELTKYLRKFADCCSGNGGLLLASFNQAATRTHRLSSSGLDYTTQFQNFTREYKPIFCSRHPGWLVGECDASGAEFRTAVHQGRDPIGLYDIISGTDVHSVTASIIGCSRQDAKPHTFKPLYGGQSGTDSERRYYQYFRDKYRGITATQRSWIDTVLNDKCLRTEWGLIYYWPDTEMDRSGYVRNSTSICNYPVQALATAEILPMALVWFWHRLRRSGLKMFIVNTIHDSIVVELPPEEQEAFTELSKQCMIEDSYYMLRKLYGIEFTVPLGTGIKIGSHWGTGEEIKYTAPEEYWKEAARKDGMLEKIED